MYKLLAVMFLGFLMLGCDGSEVAAPVAEVEVEAGSESDVKAFHPTDDISSQAQGGKGETSDGSEAQLP
jgi:hypothetical protein